MTSTVTIDWWRAAQDELAALGGLGRPLIAVATAAERAADGRGVDALQDPTFALDVLAAVPPDAFPADGTTAVVGRVLDFLRARAGVDCAATAVESAGDRRAVDLTVTAAVSPDGSAPIFVQLIGGYQVTAFGEPVRTGLGRSARELFAYFLLHPYGATIAGVVEAVWPDTRAKSASDKFWNAVKNLRHSLRAATGIVGVKLVERHGEVYRLDSAYLDTDLWQFEAVLARTVHAAGNEVEVLALQEAAAHCHGQLLDGCPYEWVEPSRENFRRRAIDALSRLADRHVRAGDRTTALVALEQAIVLDPLDEGIYQQAMRLHVTDGAAGAAGATQRLYRQLEARLGALDLEPTASTRAIIDAIHGRTPGPD